MDKYQLLNMYKVFVPRSKCIFRESLMELEEQSFQIELNYFDSEGSHQHVSFPKITPYKHPIKLYLSVQKEKKCRVLAIIPLSSSSSNFRIDTYCLTTIRRGDRELSSTLW
ncbi:hypothetical protein TNIN_269361 [Trichonephila inaurata madagascariensis]|uniref:Uncharacterized protein n=1 Tax=Trichonephila inaurata madagascariensis TaxID=2747483 RepID=A0A8X6X9V9_9ARAC|nr:hypothetical protein TNIN_269361 [Trichonephila inaurata madagascariensis]